MTTLAILQNQWGPITPDKQARIDAMEVKYHARYVAMCLFSGCVSGRRLTKAFGPDIERIAWTDASRKVSRVASGRFDHDPKHIASTMDAIKPDVILGFGNVALVGIRQWLATEGTDFDRARVLYVAHPAARYPAIQRDLDVAAETWRRMVATG